MSTVNPVRQRLRLPESGTARVFGDNSNRLEPVDRGNRREKTVRRKEGHDALIQTLAGKQATVYLQMIDNEEIEGLLLQSDRFTVSVEIEAESPPIIVFKHAIKTMEFEVPPNQSDRH